MNDRYTGARPITDETPPPGLEFGSAPAREAPCRPARARARPPFAARLVLAPIDRVAHGRLTVELPDGSRIQAGTGVPEADIRVHDWRAFSRILQSGDIGFGEGYMEGEWTTSHLPRLLWLLNANREAIDAPLYGSVFGRLANRVLHMLRANTRRGSRRNIARHYDLGNDFYALWLDRSMTYSSALWQGDETLSLEAAQARKYARVLQSLALAPGAHIVEIGCGWGGFAETAARGGHRVTGLTLSTGQLEWARRRLAGAAGTRFELLDYRRYGGRADAVVSIEMYEAVGERWWPAYFRRIAGILPAGGRAAIQAIVIRDDLFARYRRSSDFIQRYIFPGGMLASDERFRAEAALAGLDTLDAPAFGGDYARTLALWRERFLAADAAIGALGFPARFRRMWEFYLAYCEAGFRTGSTEVRLYTLGKASS